jgi:hypothetical protein
MAMKKIQATLTTQESKRLIAAGVARHPVIRRAMKSGTIVIPFGSTNAFVASELTGRKVKEEKYLAGFVDCVTCVVPKERRGKQIVIQRGMVREVEEVSDIVEHLTPEDVFIKGANAIDCHGVAGVFLAGKGGGTIGSALGTIISRGVNLLIPVGLAKMVSYSIVEASKRVGTQRFDAAFGVPVGLMPLHGTVITEIEALKLLGAGDAFQIGAGGICGGEGSVTLCVEGGSINKVYSLILKIKSESKKGGLQKDCDKCKYEKCVYYKKRTP